ncbi:MAG: hypothetical protein OEX03_11015 [Gammaproteobacteria bacterium]|nr:hypothetical protein [Gammaproteobacteria bacterium]
MQNDSHTADSPLDNNIVYQDSLPLSVKLAKASDSLSLGEQRKNLELLKSYWIFHETRTDDLKEHPELQIHLERIELKLDMQSEMLAMLLHQSIKLPVAQTFSLGAETFISTLNEQYPVGSTMRIELFLMPEYPKPLIFFAKLLAQESLGNGYKSTFELQDMDIVCRDMLEKILFRHHRRQIAQLRQSKV